MIGREKLFDFLGGGTKKKQFGVLDYYFFIFCINFNMSTLFSLHFPQY